MAKIKVTKNVMWNPMPVVLVGTQVKGRANFMAVGWSCPVNWEPPMVALAIGKKHYTATGISSTKTFSVNLPSVALLQKTDYCGIYSGEKVDKSELFEVFYGELKTAPMISQCPLNLECTLVQTVTLSTTFLFIGQVVGMYCEERFLAEGGPDIVKMEPFVLTTPDTCYHSLGQTLGKAWEIGKKLGEADR